MKIILKHLAETLSGRADLFDTSETTELWLGRDRECTVKHDEDP